MQRHPSDEELVQHHLRRGQGSAEARTAAHLESGCVVCQDTLRQLRAILAYMSAPGLAEAPSSAMSRALAWLEQRESSRTTIGEIRSVRKEDAGSAVRRAASDALTKASHRWGEAAAGVDRALKEIFATLVFDTAQGALLPGIRGTATSAARQLMYESAEGELHLQLEPPVRGRLELIGQFLPGSAETPVAAGRAVLSQAGKKSVRRLSPTGEFRFSGVAVAAADLWIEWGQIRIRIGSLPLWMDPADEPRPGSDDG